MGRIAERLGQPALLGQMVAGVLIGPSMLGWLGTDSGLAPLSDFAVIFVVITAGLEMRMQHLIETVRGRGALALLLSFLVPAIATAAFTYVLDFTFVAGSVTVLCVSVTALPVALRILSAFGLLHTRVARIAISSSLLADLIVLLLLGILIAMFGAHGESSLWQTGGIAVAKLVVLLSAVAICHYVCSHWLPRRRPPMQSEHALPAVDTPLLAVVLFMLGLGVFSDLLGFHFVIGVFFGALMMTEELLGEARFRSVTQAFELFTLVFFAPLFLAYQGVQFELGTLKDAAPLAGLITIAIGAKMLGGYAAARLNRLPHYEAYGVGIVMNARGVMEMVVASIAYRAGLITSELFSHLLIVGIVTTIITPSLLKQWLRNESKLREMLAATETRS
ncbi:MAG: cation:proton antiporter [Rhodanobacteraceae bacterium]|nr:cation:proton antiporter [Rhodanobacteraceae bacterium]